MSKHPDKPVWCLGNRWLALDKDCPYLVKHIKQDRRKRLNECNYCGHFIMRTCQFFDEYLQYAERNIDNMRCAHCVCITKTQRPICDNCMINPNERGIMSEGYREWINNRENR